MSNNNSWQKVRFDEICKNVSKRVDNPQESEYEKFVGLNHLDTLEPKIMRYGSTNDVTSSMTLFKNKQILFGRRNWYLRRVAIADFDGLCSGDIYVLEPIDKKIKKDFLPLLMHSDEFFEKNMMYSHGSMSTRVKWSNLAKLEFLIPSIAQQEEILSITDRIDHTISDAQNLLEKTKNYMVSRRESLLTRGIGHTKFKKVPWLFGKEIEIPEEWKIKSINEICKNIVSGGTPDTKNNSYWNGTIPWIRGASLVTKNITSGESSISNEGLKNSSTKIVEKNNIILSTRVSLGNISINKIDIAINQDATGLILNHTKVLTDYVYWYLKLQIYKLIYVSQGTAIKGILKRDLENFPFFFPELNEQKQIISIISRIDEQITQQQSHLTNLKVLRKSILNSKLTKEQVIAQ